MINGSGTREGEGRMKEKHTGIEIDAKGLAVQIQGSKHQCEGFYDDCYVAKGSALHCHVSCEEHSGPDKSSQTSTFSILHFNLK